MKWTLLASLSSVAIKKDAATLAAVVEGGGELGTVLVALAAFDLPELGRNRITRFEEALHGFLLSLESQAGFALIFGGNAEICGIFGHVYNYQTLIWKVYSMQIFSLGGYC